MAYLEPLKNFKLKTDPAPKPGFPTYLSVFEASQQTAPQSEAIPNPPSITNGEFGFNKEGLIVLKNNESSLYEVLNSLCNSLTAVSVALSTNTSTEPAATAAGVALAAGVVALQAQISILLAPPGTESN